MIYTMNFSSCLAYLKNDYIIGYTYTPNKEATTGKTTWKSAGSSVFNHIKSSENDSFCFIITVGQQPHFDRIIKDYGLENYIVRQTDMIRNQNYIEMPPRYKLVVLQHPNHPQRKIGYTANLTTLPA